ncbi:hypothetical protein MVEN_00524900 [Mycena venus]|uniref:Uncharacterized protein n=1 Tax=Mycena venus TaxID=2733690 RepID=A0A8H6YNB3_9AGAR|nr:hypothetical protein MVEN_00524900 [Mycena venus]
MAFKWMALVYCFLSLIFTSTSLYKYLYLDDAVRVSAGKEIVASATAFLSAEQRLSRLSPYLPHLGGSREFEPYVLLPPSPSDGITACLWSTDDGDASLHSLVSWASQWTGPISLVMVTATRPHSVSHQQLLQRLKSFRDHPSLSRLSLHLVHAMGDQHSPSAYLNLARLFATSRTVMLFPANLLNALPSDFYSTLSSRIAHPPRKPALVTTTVTSAFSIPDLTPVILPQNYPLWCTERAFLASRALDWDDCIWQLWLEEYGLGQVNITFAVNTENLASGAVEPASLTRLRNNMSGKYRAELCEVAIRRLSTADTRMSKSAKRRTQWVKSFCHQTENAVKK